MRVSSLGGPVPFEWMPAATGVVPNDVEIAAYMRGAGCTGTVYVRTGLTAYALDLLTHRKRRCVSTCVGFDVITDEPVTLWLPEEPTEEEVLEVRKTYECTTVLVPPWQEPRGPSLLTRVRAFFARKEAA